MRARLITIGIAMALMMASEASSPSRGIGAAHPEVDHRDAVGSRVRRAAAAHDVGARALGEDLVPVS